MRLGEVWSIWDVITEASEAGRIISCFASSSPAKFIVENAVSNAERSVRALLAFSEKVSVVLAAIISGSERSETATWV